MTETAGDDVPLLPSEARTDRILTIPNVITVLRLAMLPVFLWLLFGRENRAAAAGLLAVLGITDFLDGYIARHFNQVSDIGKILDPVADRLLFFVGVGAILVDGSVPTWFAVAVLVREAQCGVSIAPGDAAQLAEVVRQARNNRAEWQAMGMRGRAHVTAYYSRAIVSAQYDALIRDVAAGRQFGHQGS